MAGLDLSALAPPNKFEEAPAKRAGGLLFPGYSSVFLAAGNSGFYSVAAAITVGLFFFGWMKGLPPAPDMPNNFATCLPFSSEMFLWSGSYFGF